MDNQNVPNPTSGMYETMSKNERNITRFFMKGLSIFDRCAEDCVLVISNCAILPVHHQDGQTAR